MMRHAIARWASVCGALCSAIACGPNVPPPTTARAAPSGSAEPTALAPIEEPLAPGELRCGIDDGPVPVGLGDDDDLRRDQVTETARKAADARGFLGLRIAQQPPPPVDRAQPKITVQVKLGDGLVATDAFKQRALPCMSAGQTSDEGERSFSVRFSRSGTPIGVRVEDGPAKDGVVTRCFAAALCSSGTAAPGAVGTVVRTATLAVKVVPPVFTGRVKIGLQDDRPAWSSRPSLGRGGIPEPPPYTTAERKYLESLPAVLDNEALACAQRFTPAARVTVRVDVVFDKKTRTFSAPTAKGRGPVELALASCLGAAAAEKLRPPPARMVASGGLTLIATFLVGPTSADPLDQP